MVNCATRRKVLNWLTEQCQQREVTINERPELAILAVHGPQAIPKVCSLLPAAWADEVAALGNFQGALFNPDLRATSSSANGGPHSNAEELPATAWFIARTGYTGERGLELILPNAAAPALWDKLLHAGITPVGLGARDSLRLEAGMNLYGQDMDETISPVEANMTRTIAWEPAGRDFIGRAAVSQHLQEQQAGTRPHLTGLVLAGRGMLRAGQPLHTDRGDGIITSGGFSPILQHAIALARIPVGSSSCTVDLRGTPTALCLVPPNFVRFGKKVFE